MKYRTFSYTLLLAILLSAVLPYQAKAQSADFPFLDSLLQIYVMDYDSAGFLYFYPDSLEPGELYTAYKDSFPDDTLNKLELLREVKDSIYYFTHYHYQQTYLDLRVEAAEYTEHAYEQDADDQGYLVFSHGKFVHNIDMTLEDTLTQGAALDSAIQYLYDEETNYYFAWEDTAWQNELKVDAKDTNATYYPHGELLWAIDDLDSLGFEIAASRYTLAWRFEIFCLSPLFNKAFYVNAKTGEVFKIDDLMCSDGPATILYHASETIDTKGRFPQLDYILKAEGAGHDIWTKYPEFNGSVLKSWANTNNITDNDDNWGTSEQLGTSTHWYTTVSWDYFHGVFKRKGMDNFGGEVRVLADFPNINNAFYLYVDPAHTDRDRDYILVGSFGDDYLGSIDVLGHEFTHGVTHHSSGLGNSFEPGALNESFSDIFGTLIEFYAPDDTDDWLVGDDGDYTDLLKRSLEEPRRHGSHYVGGCTFADLVTGQPDTYQGDNWELNCDNGGVHTNNGVQNYWFYLLANGGSGTNDNGHSYNIASIGLNDAANLTYFNLLYSMQLGSQYADARAGSIMWARAIWGSCSTEEIEVTNAWAAVGVGGTSNCPPPMGISLIASKDLQVYPNPGNEQITISDIPPSISLIQIYSLNGQLIQSFADFTNKLVVTLEAYPVGMYIIKSSGSKNLRINKFIKH